MLFASKCKQQRVTLRPTIKAFGNDGTPIIRPGITVEFVNGLFETEDPSIIEMMLKYHGRGLDFLVVDDEEAAQFLAERNMVDIPVVTGAKATHAAQVRPDDLKQVKPARTHAEATADPEIRGMAPGYLTNMPREYFGNPDPVKQEADLDALIAKKLGEVLPGVLENVLAKVMPTAQVDGLEPAHADPPIPPKAESVTKPKKKFTCKICGEVFKSGIEVGAHKREKHAV